jgi:diaminopimelate epimerase
MLISFSKYQGTGNDFVMIDNRAGLINLTKTQISKLCDRRYGVGSDGLIFLQNHEGYDFQMVYHNADGSEGEMCGNGARCTVKFAYDLGVIKDNTTFLALDGEHIASVSENGNMINLKMIDVSSVDLKSDITFLNTGVPHCVKYVSDIHNYNIFDEGREIRYNTSRFGEAGTNANFIERQENNIIFVRTYERGVEQETYSCGTGATACAMVASIVDNLPNEEVISTTIQNKGGILKISFQKNIDNSFFNVWLEGPADFVFKGEIVIC